MRGRADCAKKTASGLREGRASYRLRAKAPLHTPTQPACRTPSKECTNINTVHYSTGTCNLARPPVHHRPHSVAAVCARVHVLPSCTRSSPSQGRLRASGTVTCLIGMARNQHRKHPCPACRQGSAGRRSVCPTQATQLVRWLLTRLLASQPSQPAVAQAESQSRARMI